ncbi:MAG: hypothetical protein GTO45_25880 [Candidatus Aminicenantes bacterium]|nr:hypothetical protein [Candidatus Aminicenantes bacterium]NIM82168.1 hypothetical protein [Candidatus Aminicenantes bacterium]NIN21569.1 hypothetical protein [Candidatus Aminicenantes bacterium]NIN45378.1 hypothetical protein [Candidatus Aminicenantes bacterium]NIN88199.1 hypothetical protein [Candidatus Aminicenantes bacterium]
MAQAKKIEKSESNFHLMVVNLVEKVVEFFRGLLNKDVLAFCIRWLTWIGHVGIIVAAALGFLFAIIYAIRTNSFTGFLYGIGWVILIFVIQYTAKRFLPAGEALIKNNPTQLGSKAFLDCFGFLIMIGGIIVLIMSIISAVQAGSIQPFLWGLVAFFFLEFLALVSFNPDEITINIVEENSAGQEAIGIVTFFIKSYMKLVPIFFGIYIVIGVIKLLIDMIGLFGSNVALAWDRGNADALGIIYGALLPFLAYVFFAFAYLIIDIIKAILSIPEKLDKLGK